ncbi:FecR family protein [Chitinophaga japonensis]|uniref:FecR family protein n=1 Tax=Chitinophaga japonensis TaxID=104662 RepID=A0A562TF12_CHIJA|nr:FecR domain-containing protein [Chitinophaga japonensis]TWI92119.1 FecR family protein [Chitinophaga japonensis]
MQNDKYITYTLQDFLDDDDFVRWAVQEDQANTEADAFWEAFPDRYPDHADTYRQALQFIRSYRTQDVRSDAAQKAQLWSRISATIQEEAANGHKEKMKRGRSWMKIAASLLLVIATGYLAIQYLHRNQVIDTDYGEKRTITLPDQSVVILNANSRLHYAAKWDSTAPREVWIEGEAFFDVRHVNRDTQHISPHERFLVHSDGITIEVLGTSFNVKNRHGKTNIGLITGKIKVAHTGGNAHQKQPAIVMLPGDYVEYGGEKLLSNQKLAKPEKLKDWTRKEIIFTNAALAEIIETLQDSYGYTVETRDDSIRQMKIEGEINVANVDELLTVISTTLNVKVDKSSEKHLVFYSGR